MQTVPIREAGVVGSVAVPEGPGPFLGVVALGGSNGGVPEHFQHLLVPEGFACLALEYFGSPDTQSSLTEVPLERIERGVRWLLSQPNVAAPDGRVGVVGASKGGELALLAAASFPDLIGPVVAYTPSSVVWAGIDFANPRAPMRSSWAHGGAPLPFVPYPAGVQAARSADGLAVRPIYDQGLEQLTEVEAAAIAVERATGPLLLISGGDDQMWPADRMCRMVVERMQRHGRRGDVTHLDYVAAGHVLTPYPPAGAGPSVPMPFAMGGSRDTAAAAHADAWPRVVSHLRGLG